MDGLWAGSTCYIQTPGKINLFLEVLGKRDDGFHEIETLMTAISIHDTLCFEATREGPIRLTCRWASGMEAYRVSHGSDVVSAVGELPPTHDNLVYRSLERLRQAAGVSAGARVHVQKRIPTLAGLGGASSDAAAALVAANRAWGLNWPAPRLGEWAASLGSDIPFFLAAPRATAARPMAMAVCRGRGERLEPVSTGLRLHCVLVRPHQGASTADVYRRCQSADVPRDVAPLREALGQGQLSEVGRALFNRLEPAAMALNPGLQRLGDVLHKLDLVGYGMSGSGSSFFGICHHRRHAQRVASLLRTADLGLVWTATTRPLRRRFAGPA